MTILHRLKFNSPYLLMAILLLLPSINAFALSTINVGLNTPRTGPYKYQGLAQLRGAIMAEEEINASGGIMGHPVKVVFKNSASRVDKSIANVKTLANKNRVKMLFGGSSSAVAIAAGKEAKKHNLLYFGTLTYSNATTGSEGHTHMFRETYNAWMAAKVLSKYLNKNHKGKKFIYVTADYTWGWSTEESVRQFTDTADENTHKSIKVKFPKTSISDLRAALTQVNDSDANVLILSQFGKDMARSLKLIQTMGINKKMEIIVPSLTLGMAIDAGPTVMADVVGAVPWTWKVPYQYGHKKGIKFVERFKAKYDSYPSSSAGSAYSILHQYKHAVERAGTFSTKQVIRALEDHEYTSLKGKQSWRSFDHQNIQTVYAVKGKSRLEVIKSQYHEDFFDIIDTLDGVEAARTLKEWKSKRKAANKPQKLR